MAKLRLDYQLAEGCDKEKLERGLDFLCKEYLEATTEEARAGTELSFLVSERELSVLASYPEMINNTLILLKFTTGFNQALQSVFEAELPRLIDTSKLVRVEEFE